MSESFEGKRLRGHDPQTVFLCAAAAVQRSCRRTVAGQ
jgi:hypothetical protein